MPAGASGRFNAAVDGLARATIGVFGRIKTSTFEDFKVVSLPKGDLLEIASNVVGMTLGKFVSSTARTDIDHVVAS